MRSKILSCRGLRSDTSAYLLHIWVKPDFELIKQNIMKVKIVTILLGLSVIILLDSCEDFLDYSPKGTLTQEAALALENAEKLVNAAYAAIGNDFWDRSITSMWVYGSVRSDDAYKGGGSVQDQFTINRFEQYNLTHLTLPIIFPSRGLNSTQ